MPSQNLKSTKRLFVLTCLLLFLVSLVLLINKVCPLSKPSLRAILMPSAAVIFLCIPFGLRLALKSYFKDGEKGRPGLFHLVVFSVLLLFQIPVTIAGLARLKGHTAARGSTYDVARFDTLSTTENRLADSVPPLKTVYVLDYETEVKKNVSAEKPVAVYYAGARLEVVGAEGHFWKVRGLGERRGQYLYVAKAATGDASKVPLDNEQLNEVYNPGEEVYTGDVSKEEILVMEGLKEHFDSPKAGENENQTEKDLWISIVSKTTFYSKKKEAVDYFVADTGTVRKVNGRFILNTSKKALTFKDDEEASSTYLGQYKVLNKYLIQSGSEEVEDYWIDLVDKTSGSSLTIDRFPYLSYDKTTLITIESDEETLSTNVWVCRLEKDNVKCIADKSYKSWMLSDPKELFWGKDGCFYLRVVPSLTYPDRLYYFKDNASQELNYRYIKIEIVSWKKDTEKGISVERPRDTMVITR